MQPLVAAVGAFIPGWCGKVLTPSGRTILANAVLGARAVYSMCSVLLLKGTIEAVDAQRRAFIWTGDTSCNGGQCKAAWDLVCWDRDRGGLGVKNLSVQNKGLLSKFLSKLLQPPTTNWQRWFHRLYGPQSGRDLGDHHHLDTPVWSSLLQLLPEFRRVTQVHLGNGTSTAFWLDHWIGIGPLAELFPVLFSHCARPNISVAAAIHDGTARLGLHQRLSQVAQAQLLLLHQALQPVDLLQLQDRRGMAGSMQPYSSAAFYAHQMQARPIDPFAPCIWTNAAPPKCKHFLWLLHHHRLPSAALLHHRNIIDLALCTYCGSHETQHHITLRCPGALQVWKAIGWNAAGYLASFRDLWSMPQIEDMPPKVASAVVTAVLWNIWKRRNALAFDRAPMLLSVVLRAIVADLRLWSHRLRSVHHRQTLCEWADRLVIT
ncbi:unnamed protein product [Urochloa humidicola]